MGALILKIYNQQGNTHMNYTYAWFLTEPSSLKHKYSFHQLQTIAYCMNDKVCIATYPLNKDPHTDPNLLLTPISSNKKIAYLMKSTEVQTSPMLAKGSVWQLFEGGY